MKIPVPGILNIPNKVITGYNKNLVFVIRNYFLL